MSKIVEELIAQPFSLVGTWNESCYVEEFDGYGSSAVHAGAVVGFAAVGEIVSRAGAVDLEVSDGALGIYGRETKKGISADVREFMSTWVGDPFLTESCLSRVSSSPFFIAEHSGVDLFIHAPTLELASVKLFKVVDLPLEGLPTRPMRGSRGIVRSLLGC